MFCCQRPRLTVFVDGEQHGTLDGVSAYSRLAHFDVGANFSKEYGAHDAGTALDFMLTGLCLWSRFWSFFGCWLTKVNGYNLPRVDIMFLVESLLKGGLSACSISSMASSALDQDFLAVAGKN